MDGRHDESSETTAMPQQPAPALSDAPRNQRAANRVALLLRAGKLVSEHGEFLCILRDASTGGLKARLFHELPQAQRFGVELANGERYPIELVWQRDGHAGFRFVAGPIDVHGLIDESSALPKRDIRLRVNAPVTVRVGEERHGGHLRDLSQNGAQIEIVPGMAIGQQVVLVIEGLPALVARVRWRRGAAHGVIFQRGFRLDELAALVGQLQQEPAGATEKAAKPV
jgi:PilZ domain